ncbi:GNAT family N-acetyltransferase [Sphaerisporangium album]|uniref:GNAT family N-acetyltransferase n=1 Tax=Sphaerisporangium album TaxID=509200 RepID=A0A367FI19_9ACTN|nr:GNAT family N-acetyltransferase [Sphaerisporangium album]RCG29971.1 GNAT family N-acetyltransferase [Sphaerisporangium album]
MVEVRRAVVDDAWELVRLRGVMLAAVTGVAPAPGPWREVAAGSLRTRLADPDGMLTAFVIDKPDRPGELAACAVGAIDCRLGGPDNPSGDVGCVFNVATDPGYRRRGYSRACVEALLRWYRGRGVAWVDLRASPEGEPLYRALGFVPLSSPAMRLTMPP